MWFIIPPKPPIFGVCLSNAVTKALPNSSYGFLQINKASEIFYKISKVKVFIISIV